MPPQKPLRRTRVSTKKMQENVPESSSAPHHQSNTKQFQELQTLDKLVGHPPQEKTDVAGWIFFGSSLYYVSTEIKEWTQSRQYCKESRADLVIINSIEEQNFTLKFSRIAWIGLTDVVREGMWKWVDDTPLSTGFWGRGEPNGGTRENCILFLPASGWADYPCDNAYNFICEKTIFN